MYGDNSIISQQGNTVKVSIVSQLTHMRMTQVRDEKQ